MLGTKFPSRVVTTAIVFLYRSALTIKDCKASMKFGIVSPNARSTFNGYFISNHHMSRRWYVYGREDLSEEIVKHRVLFTLVKMFEYVNPSKVKRMT